MNDIQTTYRFFRTFNYTGQQSTSSYALPFCEFTFVPDLNATLQVERQVSDKRVVWDFGDGTVTESFSGKHAYTNPGQYTVTCYVYDREGVGYYNTYTQDVKVYDYIPNTINLSLGVTSDNILNTGEIGSPALITRSTSFHYYSGDENKVPPTIVTYISGSNSINYFSIPNRHYTHLYPSHSTYALLTGSDRSTEYVEITGLNIVGSPIYTKLSGNQVIRTSKNDINSFFTGTTGQEYLYIKDDLEASQLNVLVGYESNTIKPFSNTLTLGYSAKIVKNTDYDGLSISSNGLDAEGSATASFPINKNKFANTKIAFVIKVKDSDNFTIKDIPLLTDVDLFLTDGITNYPATFYSNLASLSSLQTGGFYKGYFVTTTDTILENVFIKAECEVNGTTLYGNSNTFNIYPQTTGNKIAKKGEDIDFQQKFKEMAFQPVLLDKKVLIQDFLGTIFGSISSEQTSIGKVTYEKIKNFVNNNSVLDYANINQLLSLTKSLNLNLEEFGIQNLTTPEELNRLINILSINRSRLFGTQNKFNKNFDTYGYLNKEFYGTNLGEEIRTLNYEVIAGNYIVAFEKFSGKYTLLDTYLPLKASNVQLTTSNSYILSGYNDSWGWGLVIPTSYTDLLNYYSFYEHVPTINGAVEGGIINFDDFNTTLSYYTSSYNAWSEEDGTIANIIAQQLYTGLDLFE